MRNMMFVSFSIYLVALVVLLPSFDNYGLWAAMIIFYIVRGVTLGFKYHYIESSAD